MLVMQGKSSLGQPAVRGIFWWMAEEKGMGPCFKVRIALSLGIFLARGFYSRQNPNA